MLGRGQAHHRGEGQPRIGERDRPAATSTGSAAGQRATRSSERIERWVNGENARRLSTSSPKRSIRTGRVGRRGVDVHQPAPHRDLAALLDLGHALVAQGDQAVEQRALIRPSARPRRRGAARRRRRPGRARAAPGRRPRRAARDGRGRRRRGRAGPTRWGLGPDRARPPGRRARARGRRRAGPAAPRARPPGRGPRRRRGPRRPARGPSGAAGRRARGASAGRASAERARRAAGGERGGRGGQRLGREDDGVEGRRAHPAASSASAGALRVRRTLRRGALPARPGAGAGLGGVVGARSPPPCRRRAPTSDERERRCRAFPQPRPEAQRTAVRTQSAGSPRNSARRTADAEPHAAEVAAPEALAQRAQPVVPGRPAADLAAHHPERQVHARRGRPAPGAAPGAGARRPARRSAPERFM